MNGWAGFSYTGVVKGLAVAVISAFPERQNESSGIRHPRQITGADLSVETTAEDKLSLLALRALVLRVGL